VIKTFA
jgi:hypothetical protein